MTESGIIFNMIKESEKALGAAIMIASQIDRVKEDLLKKLHGNIKEELDAAQNVFQTEGELSYWETDQSYISFYKTTWKKYRISFQTDATQLSVFFYGISENDRNSEGIPDIGKYLGSGKTSDGYIWRRPFEYPDWSSSEKPWVEILSGEMARRIVKKAAELCDALEMYAKGENIIL